MEPSITIANLLEKNKHELGVGSNNFYPQLLDFFNPNLKYKVDISKFHSKSKNSPFDGWEVKGKVLHTLVNGKVVYSATES